MAEVCMKAGYEQAEGRGEESIETRRRDARSEFWKSKGPLAHEPLAPDEPLAVRAHRATQRYPCDPHAREERKREQETLGNVNSQHEDSSVISEAERR